MSESKKYVGREFAALSGAGKMYAKNNPRLRTPLFVSLIALIVAGCTGQTKATLNWNSIEEYGIEYYIQTDKAEYNLGETVDMLFRVTNTTAEDVLIGCSQSPEFNFEVHDQTQRVWALVHGGVDYSPGIPISAGDYEEISYTWDMTDDNGGLVEVGPYNVVGLIYNQGWNYYHSGTPYISAVEVPVSVVPEPSSLALVLTGLSLLQLKKNRS